VSVTDEPEIALTPLLEMAISENQDKLGEARPRETHLAIWVTRSDVSADPAKTSPPELPDEIDSLWVLLNYLDAKFHVSLMANHVERPSLASARTPPRGASSILVNMALPNRLSGHG
jgi:hypothetical protein